MRHKKLIAAIVLVAAGSLSLGHGLWLYAKAGLAQLLLEDAWDLTVAGGRAVRPWPWADTFPVARLRLPRLEREMIVLAGGTGRTMAFGPGHVDGSALPGHDGNCVISGHRDTHFALLEDVRRGDLIVLEGADGREHSYEVVETAVVDHGQTWVADRTDGRVLTLVTCYPFRALVAGGNLRYVVWAEGRGAVPPVEARREPRRWSPPSFNPLARRELSTNIQARGREDRFPPTGALYRIAGGGCG